MKKCESLSLTPTDLKKEMNVNSYRFRTSQTFFFKQKVRRLGTNNTLSWCKVWKQMITIWSFVFLSFWSFLATKQVLEKKGKHKKYYTQKSMKYASPKCIKIKKKVSEPRQKSSGYEKLVSLRIDWRAVPSFKKCEKNEIQNLLMMKILSLTK